MWDISLEWIQTAIMTVIWVRTRLAKYAEMFGLGEKSGLEIDEAFASDIE